MLYLDKWEVDNDIDNINGGERYIPLLWLQDTGYQDINWLRNIKGCAVTERELEMYCHCYSCLIVNSISNTSCITSRATNQIPTILSRDHNRPITRERGHVSSA